MSNSTNRVRSRWSLVIAILAVLGSAPRPITASTPVARGAAAPKDHGRINVLFLITDEQHYQSLSATGNPYITTPNMDRIAHEGVRFEHATCVTPYCSPSRATMITGLYPHRHRILQNVSPGRNKQAALAQDAFPNTESILHGAGYFTAHRGKWHLGDKGDFSCYQSWAYASRTGRVYRNFLDEHLPLSKFSDHRSPGRYLDRPVEMIPAIEKGYELFRAQPNNRLAYIGIIGRSVIPPKLLPETQITNDVLKLIKKYADKNFMITASWSPPHDLWVIPEPYYSMVDRNKIQLPGSLDMPAWDQRGPSKRLGEVVGQQGLREYAAIYHGMVKYIDDQVGRVLNKLDELGLTENTLVIFTSDHGDMVGAHGCVGKSITSFYEDLVRIPLLIRLPGKIRPGTVVSHPVSQVDFLPTILDYVDFPVPQDRHGKSLRPLIEGRKVAWRDYAFCQRADTARMLSTQRYKFVYRPRPRIVALYDLQHDPHENHNLAEDPAHAETVTQMHRRLIDVMKADGDPALAKFMADPVPVNLRRKQ